MTAVDMYTEVRALYEGGEIIAHREGSRNEGKRLAVDEGGLP